MRIFGQASCRKKSYDLFQRCAECDGECKETFEQRAGRAPRVFVVQQPAFYCRETRKFVAKYDLTPATAHGQLVFVLGPGNIYKDRMDQATRQMSAVLANYSEADFILAVGDPVAIAAAVLIAGAHTGGRIKLLKWDRISSAYEAFPINIH